MRSTTVATTSAVAGRALGQAAGDVGRALDDGDLERARALLPTLVGRDPSGLDEGEIARAAVESVAENTVDAVVAPALWAAVAGAPGALGYRAVNTLDSMVGHRSERYANYGWASARLDDAVAWVPARLTAALVALVRPRAARPVWTAVRTQAPAHPSPNAGVAEAAFAAALGVRLGGTQPLRRASGGAGAARHGPGHPRPRHRRGRPALARRQRRPGRPAHRRRVPALVVVAVTTAPPAPGAHGGDGRAVARALGLDPDAVLDLSLSLNPLAPDPGPVVARHLAALRAYPDPADATRALAEAMGVEPARLLLTNGGAEAIALVAAEIGGRVDEPDFALHPRGDGPALALQPAQPDRPPGRRRRGSGRVGRGVLPAGHRALDARRRRARRRLAHQAARLPGPAARLRARRPRAGRALPGPPARLVGGRARGGGAPRAARDRSTCRPGATALPSCGRSWSTYCLRTA